MNRAARAIVLSVALVMPLWFTATAAQAIATAVTR
jgi:hypothetical protein